MQINVVIYKYFITSDFLKKTTSLKEVHIIENNINLVNLFKQEADEYVVNKDGKQGAFDDSAETQGYEKGELTMQEVLSRSVSGLENHVFTIHLVIFILLISYNLVKFRIFLFKMFTFDLSSIFVTLFAFKNHFVRS